MKRKAGHPESAASRFGAEDVPAAVLPLLSAARDGRDMKGAIADAVRALGFDTFAFLRSRRNAETSGWAFSVWGSFPAEWEKVYRQRNYRAIDPRWTIAVESSVPELWYRSRYPDSPELHELFDTAASFGICSGIVMAVNQPSPNYVEVFSVTSGIATVDGARRQSIARSMGDLWAVGAYGHRLLPEAARAMLGPDNGVAPLSARELECLAHAARGATSRTIAGRLAISERTVNAHIERAIRKCGAKNRHEAIARAISDGAIDL